MSTPTAIVSLEQVNDQHAGTVPKITGANLALQSNGDGSASFWGVGGGGTTLTDAPHPQMPLVWDNDAGVWRAQYAFTLYYTGGSPLGLYPIVFSEFGVYVEYGGASHNMGLGVLGVQDALTFGVSSDGSSARLAFFGAPVTDRQSITGATTADQVESIIATLVALGLATDDR